MFLIYDYTHFWVTPVHKYCYAKCWLCECLLWTIQLWHKGTSGKISIVSIRLNDKHAVDDCAAHWRTLPVNDLESAIVTFALLRTPDHTYTLAYWPFENIRCSSTTLSSQPQSSISQSPTPSQAPVVSSQSFTGQCHSAIMRKAPGLSSLISSSPHSCRPV